MTISSSEHLTLDGQCTAILGQTIEMFRFMWLEAVVKKIRKKDQ